MLKYSDIPKDPEIITPKIEDFFPEAEKTYPKFYYTLYKLSSRIFSPSSNSITVHDLVYPWKLTRISRRGWYELTDLGNNQKIRFSYIWNNAFA